MNMDFDQSTSLAGWTRPYHSSDQRTLFPETREEVLARFAISLDEASDWFVRGWLSFDINLMREIDEPELCEITFIAMLDQSLLTRDQISRLLSNLQAPYRYDYRKTAYHFNYGWVMPKEPDEVLFAEQLDEWLEEQVCEENVDTLWEIIEKAQAAIKRVQQADGTD